jgi:hypothetical protein
MFIYKDNSYLTFALLNQHKTLRYFLAAHKFSRLWAFFMPGVFKVFDRVAFAGQKSQSFDVNKR